MARTNVAPVVLDDAGVLNAGTAGTVDGHMFSNNGDVIIVLKNGGAGSHTVTIPTPAKRDDLDVAERTIVLAAGAEKYAGPFTPSIYNQIGGADAGKVYVNYDATQSEVTLKALKLP